MTRPTISPTQNPTVIPIEATMTSSKVMFDAKSTVATNKPQITDKSDNIIIIIMGMIITILVFGGLMYCVWRSN